MWAKVELIDSSYVCDLFVSSISRKGVRPAKIINVLSWLKSYNTLTGLTTALETQNISSVYRWYTCRLTNAVTSCFFSSLSKYSSASIGLSGDTTARSSRWIWRTPSNRDCLLKAHLESNSMTAV